MAVLTGLYYNKEMNKKIVVISGGILGLATAAIIPFTTHSNPPLPTKPTSAPVTGDAPMNNMTDPEQTLPKPATTDATTVPVPTAQVDSAPPAYGEDPGTPGVYIVFDRTVVMTTAGIPIDQQADAETLLTKIMNWRYKITGQDANLCYILPGIKMANEGADYQDNPITQLRYCHKLVSARYGNWTAALQQYKGSGGF